MHLRRVSAREVSRRQLASEKPSHFISHISALRRGQKVVLFVRVSEPSQLANLKYQLANLEAIAEANGWIVVGIVECVGLASRDYKRPRRPSSASKLYEAAELARQCGAVVVAECPSRFRRTSKFHPKTNHQPDVEELEELRWFTLGIKLVTVLPPDNSPRQETGYQSKRGQQGRGRVGGGDRMPGYKKRKREREKPRALELHSKGTSLRKIADETGVNYRTIYDWIRSMP